MRYILTTITALLCCTTIHAADAKASALLVKALTCDISEGKTQAVLRAVKALGGAPGKEANDYALPSPVTVFGLPITAINVSSGDGESADSYIAILPNAQLSDVAKAAALKPLAGAFVRDTKRGRISADIFNRTEVWLTCTPTQ